MRVLVVSASSLAQVGLGALVEQAEGLDVAGAVALSGASDAIQRLGPDAVVLDAGPDGPGALLLLERLGREAPGTPVVVVCDEPSLSVEVLSAGAAAAIPADIDPAGLGATFRAVAAGLVVLDPALLAGLLPAGGEGDETRPVERLTPRESEVLQLLARGLTNAEIGRRLAVSEHTAKFHVGAVLGKLGARSRAEAVALASRLGWITV